MELVNFRVRNYRSIHDSGVINVEKITALLGRNESGKTNLLRALASINPASGDKTLNKVKDFPRHLALREFSENDAVVETYWKLNEDEQSELLGICPNADATKNVSISRTYKGTNLVWFSAPATPFDSKEVSKNIEKFAVILDGKSEQLPEEHKAPMVAAIKKFREHCSVGTDKIDWADNFVAGSTDIQKAIAVSDISLTANQEEKLDDLTELAKTILQEKNGFQKGMNWLVERMPKFVFLEEYPELPGHQNISEYMHRRTHNQLKPSDENFERLCKVADLDPSRLHELSSSGHEERNQLANRAGAVVTREIRRLWKDRPLKLRFNLDGQHFDTFVSDPNHVYEVEINLDERSRGFQWFLAFYIVFAADTKHGEHQNAILLLDEPGLYLHAKSQHDLLKHFINDFENQILYTTHSPFMVPTMHLDWVRTVNIDEDHGTTVTNDPSGDERTLFPLQAALGYDLAQNLFVSGANLVVEGVTDYWILSSVSDYLKDQGKKCLPEVTLTPAGGAQKVPYMASLLASEALNVMVLLDYEKDAEQTRTDLLKSKVVRADTIISVGDAFEASKLPKEADIEDILDPAVYMDLVKESYISDLKGKKLELNENIPRIAKRVEIAFNKLGLQFNKSRPTKLFMKKMGAEPEKLLTPEVLERFERLFSVMAEKFERQAKRDSGPFES